MAADHDFAATIAGCAAAAPGREDTWINPEIERLFTELHRQGYAHSVECRHAGVLVGGLYGVIMGGAFFGESMFSRARDASKVALVHLVARLRIGGFRLLDTQFLTNHLTQFGAVEIPRDAYKALLAAAVDVRARWLPVPEAPRLEAGNAGACACVNRQGGTRPKETTMRMTELGLCAALGAALAAAAAVPAAAQSRPAFPPQRDVAVTYRLESSAAVPPSVLVRYSAATQRLRADGELPGYALLDLESRHAVIVLWTRSG